MKSRLSSMEQSLKTARAAQKALYTALERYRQPAARGALLFAQVTRLSALDAMYTFSLESFLHVFQTALEEAAEIVREDDMFDIALHAPAAEVMPSGIGGASDSDLAPNSPPLGLGLRKDTGGAISDGDTPKVRQMTDMPDFPEAQSSIVIFNATSEPQELVTRKVQLMMRRVTTAVHRYVSLGLRRWDRLPFGALLWIAVLREQGEGPPANLVQCFLRGFREDCSEPVPEEVAEWLAPQRWAAAVALSKAAPKVFGGFADSLCTHGRWRLWCGRPNPEREVMPGAWREADAFTRLLVLRCLRPDSLPRAVADFTTEILGEDSARASAPPIHSLLRSPPGGGQLVLMWTCKGASDPLVDVAAIHSRDEETLIQRAAVGDGHDWQGRAESAIRDCGSQGGWCLLHDVHLAPAWWLPRLEFLLDVIEQEKNMDPRFRLVFSADADCAASLPQGLRQRASKWFIAGNGELGACAAQAWDAATAESSWEGLSRHPELRGVGAQLCLLHAFISLRIDYGRRGWARCNEYAFSSVDVTAVIWALRTYFDTPAAISWSSLRRVVDLVYDGHFADGSPDHCVVPQLASLLVNDEGLRSEVLAGSGVTLPAGCPRDETREVLMNSPWQGDDAAAVAGLLAGSTMPRCTAEAAVLCSRLKYFGVSEAEESEPDAVSLVAAVEAALPDGTPDARLADRLGAVPLASSHALGREVTRLDKLLQTIRFDLARAESEEVLRAIAADTVPPGWRALSPNCVRPLGSWLAHLRDRSRWLRQWASTAALLVPKVVMLGMLSAPRAFLSSVMVSVSQSSQTGEHVREGQTLERMVWYSEVTKKTPEQVDIPARDGVHLYGLLLDGAYWNVQSQRIEPPPPRNLTHPLPVVTLRATTLARIEEAAAIAPDGVVETYACPVYPCRTRDDVVLTLDLPRGHILTAAKWALAGCAILLDESAEPGGQI
eukprot:Hpha_TRINITY_DN14425_c0_g2::TRINITY_DN14425_c0_g2_i1::g.157585::m.157585/K10408/DNAH; dynein heavy chain, axonemal